jgi:hypothetical protein
MNFERLPAKMETAHKRLSSNDPAWLEELEKRLNQVAQAQESPRQSPMKRKDVLHLCLDDLGVVDEVDVPQVHSAPPETVLPERLFDPLRSATALDGFMSGIGKRHSVDYFSFRPAKSPLGPGTPLQTVTPQNTPMDNGIQQQKRKASGDSEEAALHENFLSSLDKLSLESMPSMATLQGDLDLLSASESIPTRILSIYGIQPWISPFDLEKVLSVRIVSFDGLTFF